MKIVVLTGAGASVSLGFPTMQGFIESLEESDAVIATCLGCDLKLAGEPPAVTPAAFDLETLLLRLELLGDLPKVVSPGVAHTLGFSLVPPKVKSFVERLSEQIRKTYDRDPVDGLERFGKFGQIHGAFFQRLLGVAGEPIDVFTTNYDRSIEALQRLQQQQLDGPPIQLVDGFESFRSRHTFVFTPDLWSAPPSSPRTIRLYHIHGSFHWHRKGNTIVSIPSEDSRLDPLVVLPGPQKRLQLEEPPFSDLYRQFLKRVCDADVVIAIGYSGRDEEIASRLAVAATRNPRLRVIALMPDFPAFGWLGLKELLEDRFTHFKTGFEKAVETDQLWDSLKPVGS